MASSNKFWTRHFQDPFGKRIAAIIDPISLARSSGALKYEDVIAAQQKLEDEITAFSAAQQAYEGLGGDQSKTIAGSRRTLDPIIAAWRASLAGDLAGLAPPAEDSSEAGGPAEEPPSTAGPIPGTGGKTILTAAKGAAEQQKKRAMGSGGRGSTFLTRGPQQKASVQRRSILGY